MKTILGLDIGTNSIGCAWVDLEEATVELSVGIFPAGVADKKDGGRGAPKNQKRRQVRSQRRSIQRRARRKQHVRRVLSASGLLPTDETELQTLFASVSFDPWSLRRDGLARALTPHEFGRVLLHLAQRRGAAGLRVADDEVDPDGSKEDGLVKDAIDRLRAELNGRTVGHFMADLRDADVQPISDSKSGEHRQVERPIRNRLGEFSWHADRALIRDEFNRLWETQKAFGSPLSRLLTDDLRLQLDDSEATETWRHQGALFGQRNTYWDAGTLGRCDLEPSAHQCPKCDMLAQEFLVLEYVNNLRIDYGNAQWVSLSGPQRAKVLDRLRRQKTVSVGAIKKLLKIDGKSRAKDNLPDTCRLNMEVDGSRPGNTDWFWRTFIADSAQVFGEEEWEVADDTFRDDVNRAVLKYDPENPLHQEKLRHHAIRFWSLDAEQVDRLVAGWKTRPRKDTRIKLSRRALTNLLPYLRKGLSVSEARQQFAGADPNTTATTEQRRSYGLSGSKLNKADRHFIAKHEGELPPAPNLSNPVVRKAIHEVRRQVNAWIRRKGTRPDCVVIELAREAAQTTKQRNDELALIRRRDAIRKGIVAKYDLGGLRKNQQNRAVERVLLAQQQQLVCAYSGNPITERMAADGANLEVDHIIPRSRCHDNSMVNKVLVFREQNRDKGNRTVKEWLGADSKKFAAVESHLGHLSGSGKQTKLAGGYFTAGNCERKWKSLHQEAPSMESFQASQLTDTAYAARQVAGYLKDALYYDAPEDKRLVFATKGQYTAMLRRDWGLVESMMEQQLPGRNLPAIAEETQHGESGTAQRNGKDRRDHIHHAIDAVAIAFCRSDLLPQIAAQAKAQIDARTRNGQWLQRSPLSVPEPWNSFEQFRQTVWNAAADLIVSHRPVKRRLTGKFHEETLLGPVVNEIQNNERHRSEDPETLFTNRINVTELKPAHLRVPLEWDQLTARLHRDGVSKAERKTIRKELSVLPDPRPGKSGIVRDRELRSQLRRCIRAIGLDPDNFTDKDLKPFVDDGSIKMVSGVPIKRVILLRVNTSPVRIDRRKWNEDARRYEVPTEQKVRNREQRVYVGGNNHHMEIREDAITGKWTGLTISTFEAVHRVRKLKQSAVDRSDSADGKFVMSLAEGEILYCRRRDRPEEDPSWYVVSKLDRKAAGQDRIELAPHWDARPAKLQDRWDVTAADLKTMGPTEGEQPRKFAITALGEAVERRD